MPGSSLLVICSCIIVAALAFSIFLLITAIRFVKCTIPFRCSSLVVAYYTLPGKDLKRSYGEWAMVTGASDGIGLGCGLFHSLLLGYAKRLASRGINVVLVARSQERLDKAAAEIQDQYHVTV